MVSKSGQCLVVSESQSILSLLHSFPDLRLLCVCTARQSLRVFSVQVTARVCWYARAYVQLRFSLCSHPAFMELFILSPCAALCQCCCRSPFSSSSAQLSWTCRAPPACVVVLLRGARYCTRCVLLVVVVACKSRGTLSCSCGSWCSQGCR